MDPMRKPVVGKCPHCWRESSPANDGCDPIREDMPSFSRRYGGETWWKRADGSHCPGCGARVGKLHHTLCWYAQCVTCEAHSLNDCECPTDRFQEGLGDE